MSARMSHTRPEPIPFSAWRPQPWPWLDPDQRPACWLSPLTDPAGRPRQAVLPLEWSR
jgi:hypothetical protein